MKFSTQDDTLTIELEGLEKLWALKSRLQIPRYSISEVDYLAQRPIIQDYWGYLRWPGTNIPWRFLAGTFWRKGKREFWFVRVKQPGVMTILLQENSFPYHRLRISCLPEIAQDITDWWRGK